MESLKTNSNNKIELNNFLFIAELKDFLDSNFDIKKYLHDLADPKISLTDFLQNFDQLVQKGHKWKGGQYTYYQKNILLPSGHILNITLFNDPNHSIHFGTTLMTKKEKYNNSNIIKLDEVIDINF